MGSCRGHLKLLGEETVARNVAGLMIASEQETCAQGSMGGLEARLLCLHNVITLCRRMLRYSDIQKQEEKHCSRVQFGWIQQHNYIPVEQQLI